MIGIVLAAVLWGTTGAAATLLPPAVSPLTTGAATMTVGGLLLAATAPRRTLSVLRGRRAAWRWLLPGALCVAVYPLAFYTSMSLAGVAIGNVVALGTAPVFAALLERVLDPPHRRHPWSRRWVAAAATSVAGVGVLALLGHAHRGSPAGDGGSGRTLAGIALGALAGLTYAGYTYTASRLMAAGRPSQGVMAAQFAAGALLLLPVLVATAGGLLRAGTAAAAQVPRSPLVDLIGTPPALAVLAYLAAGPMFCAYVLFGRGLRTVPSSRATTVTLLEPVVATLLAVVAVGERLTAPGWAGLVLVLGGVVAAVTEPRRTPTAPTAPAAPGTPRTGQPAAGAVEVVAASGASPGPPTPALSHRGDPGDPAPPRRARRGERPDDRW